MGKKWGFLILFGMSCPAFAGVTTLNENTNANAKSPKIVIVSTSTQTENTADADAVSATGTNPGTTPVRGRAQTTRNPSLRWHTMLPGMFR